MPSFPCDNTDEIFPVEIYEGIEASIPIEEKRLGRKLTDEEIDDWCRSYGVKPNPSLYRGVKNHKNETN